MYRKTPRPIGLESFPNIPEHSIEFKPYFEFLKISHKINAGIALYRMHRPLPHVDPPRKAPPQLPGEPLVAPLIASRIPLLPPIKLCLK
jgi:hypothetical protein